MSARPPPSFLLQLVSPVHCFLLNLVAVSLPLCRHPCTFLSSVPCDYFYVSGSVISVLVRVTLLWWNTTTKNKLRRKGFFWLTLHSVVHHWGKVRTETQAGQDPGGRADTEAMEVSRLLVCTLWLTQCVWFGSLVWKAAFVLLKRINLCLSYYIRSKSTKGENATFIHTNALGS